MKQTHMRSIVVLCTLCLFACDKHSIPTGESSVSITLPGVEETIPDEYFAEVFEAGNEVLVKSLALATKLKQAVDKFLAEPNRRHLSDAQKSWIPVTIEYRRFYLFRQLGLVEPTIFAQLNRLDYQIASYPIQPGFLDTFSVYRYSGLVHDIGFPLTEESLTNQHGLTDLSDVVLGFYAIEFLLFNQGVERKVEDFLPVNTLDAEHIERGFKSVEEIPNNRRRRLLALQTQILRQDLVKLIKIWNEDAPDSVRSLWTNMPVDQTQRIAEESLNNALAQILIDISGLKLSGNESDTVSPNIRASDFPDQQRFILYALESILTGIKFLKIEKRSLLEKSFEHAIDTSQGSEFTETAATNDYWNDMFTHIKQARDALLTETI